MKRNNATIAKAGLYLMPHYNRAEIRLELEFDGGGRVVVTVPQAELGKFIRIFIDDPWFDEDGFYLETIAGEYVRVEMEDGRVRRIGHIVRNKWYETSNNNEITGE